MRALLRAHVEATRAAWLAAEAATGVHRVIDDILDGPQDAPPAVAAAIARASGAIAADPRWSRLGEAFALGPSGLQWLALLAACEEDPRLTRVLGYLDDSLEALTPTPAAAARLWDWPAGHRPDLGSVGLATARGPQRTDPWVIAPDIAAYLCGADAGPAGSAAAGLDCLFPDLLRQMLAAATAVLGQDSPPVEIELSGPPGSGRRTLLAQLCAALGRPSHLVASAADLRMARLLGAVPLVTGDAPGGAPLTMAARVTPAAGGSALRLSWPMPYADAARRVILWRSRSDRPAPAVVREWDLTPADIGVAAAAAPAGDVTVARVVRARLRSASLSSMTAMDRPYEWADLIVPGHLRVLLEDLGTRVRLRQEVLGQWEFGRLCPDSPGVTALFAGPSGTGKTMAAQVLARSLGLDLYRVDLAEVVNKYIGETEKRLAEVFAECERSHVMVLFDEADALFGQRTRVREGHDRFANIEIDYLLQRMDTFTGVAILATNRKSDLDAAFLRRIRVVADFAPPTEAERLRLWRLALPERTTRGEPVAAVLDRDWLARTLDLTGAEIKAVALSAAFAARAQGDLIGTGHVLAAARRELGKRGAVLRAEHLAVAP
jgi:hypothetical protein